MPGENYSIYGCGVNRRDKGAGLFKPPSEDQEWRKTLTNLIMKSSGLDSSFKAQLEKDTVNVHCFFKRTYFFIRISQN